MLSSEVGFLLYRSSSRHRTEYRHELGNTNRAPPNRCNIRSQPLTADEKVHTYSIDGSYRKKLVL